MQRWDYHSESVNVMHWKTANGESITEMLRRHGESGWELVASMPHDVPNQHVMVFKRPK